MKRTPTRNDLEERIRLLEEDLIKCRQTENALKESEQKFFESFLKSPVPMAITSMKEGRYIDVNEALASISVPGNLAGE